MRAVIGLNQISKFIDIKTTNCQFYFRIITKKHGVFPHQRNTYLTERQISDDARAVLYKQAIEMVDDII